MTTATMKHKYFIHWEFENFNSILNGQTGLSHSNKPTNKIIHRLSVPSHISSIPIHTKKHVDICIQCFLYMGC